MKDRQFSSRHENDQLSASDNEFEDIEIQNFDDDEVSSLSQEEAKWDNVQYLKP